MPQLMRYIILSEAKIYTSTWEHKLKMIAAKSDLVNKVKVTHFYISFDYKNYFLITNNGKVYRNDRNSSKQLHVTYPENPEHCNAWIKMSGTEQLWAIPVKELDDSHSSHKKVKRIIAWIEDKENPVKQPLKVVSGNSGVVQFPV